MEEELRALLTGSAAVTLLVPDTSISWSTRYGLPAVVMHTITDRPDYHMKGASGLCDALVQIDCWASTWVEAVGIARAVEAALSGYRGGIFNGVFLEGRRSSVEIDDAAPDGQTPTDYHRQSLDFRVRHSTAN